MFNIDEIKLLCDKDFGPFYLSPKSTYEYILYGDIDYFEILVDEPLDQWIKRLKHIEYKNKDHELVVQFRDELFELHVIELKKTIEDYLNDFDFNIDGVAIRVSDDNKYKTFACYQEKYCASWVDPNNLKSSIKDGLIKPIHLDEISSCGDKIFMMLSKMVELQLDLDKKTIDALKNQTYYIDTDIKSYFLKILSYRSSYHYISLLDDLGLLAQAFPLITAMKAKNIWSQGLEHLRKLEVILLKTDLFSDGVHRIIHENLMYDFDCGLTKLQMIKISILFYKAHEVMLLKFNSPERYEQPYKQFCDQFGFKEEACRYYSLIIKSSQEANAHFSPKLTSKEQYEFFEAYEAYTIDVLLILLIQESVAEVNVEVFEYLVEVYKSKYLEIQSINSEITTLDIERNDLSDVNLTLLIEEVKEKIFFGNLRYNRKSIIAYLQKLIEQS